MCVCVFVCALLLAHVSEWKRDGDLNDPTDEHLNDSSQAALAWRDNRKKALPPPDGSGISGGQIQRQ